MGSVYNGSTFPNFAARPATLHGFDRESGQVFTEKEVPFYRTRPIDWENAPRTPSLVKKPHRAHGHGARSLSAMARSKVAAEAANLNPDHLVDVPWVVAESIWKELLSTHSESFRAWKTFASTFYRESEFGDPVHRYLLNLKVPSSPLASYFHGVTSPGCAWLTCLRLSSRQVSTVDLVAIQTISNLAILDLSDGQTTIDSGVSKFDERVMSSWADLAGAGQAFRHLRVLLFGWQESLSHWIFKYVDQFPSLCHIIVTDCPRMHQRNRSEWESVALTAGWDARRAKKSAKSLRPVLGDPSFCLGSVSGCFYDTLDRFGSLAHPRRPPVARILPVVEVWLGSPRPWSHIVDDFPSTRTIFFENVKTQASSMAALGPPAHGHPRDPAKRARHHDLTSTDTASPPGKRATEERPRARPGGKSVTDLLQEFQS